MEWDPRTGAELAHDIRRGRAGRHGRSPGRGCTTPSAQHPLDRSFAFAFIRLDGADTPLLHAVDAGSTDAMSDGMRVAPRWRAERQGHITDIACFVPGEQPEVDGDDVRPDDEPSR